MKIKRIILVMIISLMLLCLNVYGAEIAIGLINLKTDASTTAVQQGETFTVTFGISGINSNYPITEIDVDLYIDSELYELVSIESLVENLHVQTDKSINSSYADDMILINTNYTDEEDVYPIAINYASGFSSNTDIFVITLKVNSDVEDGEYSDSIVARSGLIVSSGDDENYYYVSESNPVVLIGDVIPSGSSSSGTDTDADDDDSYIDSTTDDEVVSDDDNDEDDELDENGTTTDTEDDPTVASGTLPNTGYKLLIVPALILIVLGIVFFKKYRSYKEI